MSHRGFVYTLHFVRPYGPGGGANGRGTAKHYTGFTKDVDTRIAEHRSGRGSRLMEVIRSAGIDFVVAKVEPGDRDKERQLKKHSAARRCPVCQGRDPEREREEPQAEGEEPCEHEVTTFGEVKTIEPAQPISQEAYHQLGPVVNEFLAEIREEKAMASTEWAKGAKTADEIVARQIEAGRSAEEVAERWELCLDNEAATTPPEKEWHAGAEETGRDMITEWREMQAAEAEQRTADKESGVWHFRCQVGTPEPEMKEPEIEDYELEAG